MPFDPITLSLTKREISVVHTDAAVSKLAWVTFEIQSPRNPAFWFLPDRWVFSGVKKNGSRNEGKVKILPPIDAISQADEDELIKLVQQQPCQLPVRVMFKGGRKEYLTVNLIA